MVLPFPPASLPFQDCDPDSINCSHFHRHLFNFTTLLGHGVIFHPFRVIRECNLIEIKLDSLMNSEPSPKSTFRMKW